VDKNYPIKIVQRGDYLAYANTDKANTVLGWKAPVFLKKLWRVEMGKKVRKAE
jgi:hypothetical protein